MNDEMMRITIATSTDAFVYPPPSADAGPATWATWAARVFVEACDDGQPLAAAQNLAALAASAASCNMGSAAVGIGSILAQLQVSE